ncbi:MAG: threonine synthase [Flavobacteriales bacterium]
MLSNFTLRKSFNDLSLREDASLKCLDCENESELSLQFECPKCGGAQKVIYPNLTALKKGRGMSRYASVLPIRGVDWGRESSPLIRLDSVDRVWAKNEGALPNGNTKYRQALVSVASFLSRGVHQLVVASTGNSANSYCHAAFTYAPQLELDVFVPASHQGRIKYGGPNISLHVSDVDFVESGILAKKFSIQTGRMSDGGFMNPYRREGLKIGYLEAIEQFIKANGTGPDFFVQAISSGMGIVAAHSAFSQAIEMGLMDHMPAMIAVQQETCAPVVTAFNSGKRAIQDSDIIRNPKGLASAILRGNPSRSYPYLLKVIEATQGTFVSVDADALRASKKMLAADGIEACYAASATHAAVNKLRNLNHESVQGNGIVMITGSKD